MSPPIDLLSESLASSTSLLNQLMRRSDESGPTASALLARKRSRKLGPNRLKRQRQPTEGTTTEAPESAPLETLVFACPEPEGCPTPIEGEKYEPTRNFNRVRNKQNLQLPATDPPPKKSLVQKTIFRQDLEENQRKKTPMKRIRKKQRRPIADAASENDAQDEVEILSQVSPQTVQMVNEMIREAGPVLSPKEVEIIVDVSQEVGAQVNKEQIKVISMLSEAMGPFIDKDEAKTIAEIASLVEPGTSLPPDNSLEVVAAIAKSKVGDSLSTLEKERMRQIISSGEPSEAEPQSGLSDHGADMLAQMMANLGPEVSSLEVAIVADMIKELDKDITKETAELMATVLKEAPDVSREVVHNISAIVSIDQPTLSKDEVEAIAIMVDSQLPSSDAVLSPEAVEIVVEMISEEGASPKEIVSKVEQITSEEIREESVEMIQHITEMLGADKMANLAQSDLAIISLMTSSDSSSDKDAQSRPSSSGKISEKEAKFLSEILKLFGTNVAQSEKSELKSQITKADPTMSNNDAEVMVQVLAELGPSVDKNEIMQVAELVKDPSVDLRADNVQQVIEVMKKVDAKLDTQEVKVVAEMVGKMGRGPKNLSVREMQTITRMGKQAGVDDLTVHDVQMIAEVVQEIGQVSDSEAHLLAMIIDDKDDEGKSAPMQEIKDAVNDLGNEISETEKSALADQISQVMGNEVTQEEAEAIAEIIQETGPSVSEDTITDIVEAVEAADNINTADEVKNVTKLVEEMGSSLKAEEILVVLEVMKQMNVGSSMSSSEMNQIARSSRNFGANVTPNDVKVIHDIETLIDAPITEDDAKMIEVIAEALKEDQADISQVEAEHVAEMVQLGIETSGIEKVAEMIHEMGPELSIDKVVSMTQVLAEIAPKVDSSVVAEVAKIMADIEEPPSRQEVAMASEMAEKLGSELSPEQVKVIAGVMEESRSHTMSKGDLQKAANMANQVASGNVVDAEDVKIVADIIDLVDNNNNVSDDEAGLVAVITKAANEDILTTDSSQKSNFPGRSSVSEVMAEKVADMIKLANNDNDNLSPSEENQIAKEIVEMANVDKNSAKVAVKLIDELTDKPDGKTVMKVVEMVKDPQVDIPPENIAVIADLAKELPAGVTPKEIMVVSNLASKMGSSVTNREMQTIMRMAKSSGVDLELKEVSALTEIVKNTGGETSHAEAEIVAMLAQSDEKSIIDDTEASQIAQIANEAGSFMSSQEVDQLEEAIKAAAPQLESNEVGIMTEILQKLDNPDKEDVQKAAEVAGKIGDELTVHAVDVIGDMAEKLDKKLSENQVMTVIHLVEQAGPQVTPREMQMIERMAKSQNIDVSQNDIKIVQEMVQMLGPSASEAEMELVAFIAEEVSSKDSSEEKEMSKEIMETLESIKTKGSINLPDMRELEEKIEKVEPLLTSSKVQVMSKVLIESDPSKIDSNDIQELTEIVMEASDDISPQAIGEIAEVARKAENVLTEKEVKVVADMSAKLGESLSNREAQMIARMMKSSGIFVTMNDIQTVATVAKMIGKTELSRGDAKLIAKMTEIISEEPPAGLVVPPIRNPGTFQLVSGDRPRLTMNVHLKNRIKARPPPSSTYLPPSNAEEQQPEPFEEVEVTGFGLREENPPPPRPQFIPAPVREATENPGTSSFPNFPNENLNLPPTFGSSNGASDSRFGNNNDNPDSSLNTFDSSRFSVINRLRNRQPIMRPTLETFTSTEQPSTQIVTESPSNRITESTTTASTRIMLEEFLMRARPTSSTASTVNQPLNGNQFKLAVDPNESPRNNVLNLPGESFMQINMGPISSQDGTFGQQEILRENEFNAEIRQPDFDPAPVSKDTLKSVAENFSFANDKPQSMLMNFLLKNKPVLPPMPTLPPPEGSDQPNFDIWDEPPSPTRTPIRNIFNIESTTLDKSAAGNFIHMKMGSNDPMGVDPSILPKLVKNKINLSEKGNSFMSFHMGDILKERMSSIEPDDEGDDEDGDSEPMRKIMISEGDPWATDNEETWKEKQTPFTVRPTLPVGQVKLWPNEVHTPTLIPFTVKPTKKPYIFLNPTETSQWATDSPQTPFTVKPTKTPSRTTFTNNSPYGANKLKPKSSSYVHHDVQLKSPYDNIFQDFKGNEGFMRESNFNSHPHANSQVTHQQPSSPANSPDVLEGGYKGIGLVEHPGLHDDRPPYTVSEDFEYDNPLKPTFGDLEFNLPNRGSFPDRPLGGDVDPQVLRDLPTINQEEDADSKPQGNHQYGKSYLKNPYGADFIRLEIDSDRYKHNKTRRVGGIHHIPLKINGYAETSEFPVSADTERPPPLLKRPLLRNRPKKQAIQPPPMSNKQPSPSSSVSESNDASKPVKPFKAVADNFPNAIQNIPNFMHSLVSNHASWIDKVWSNALNKGEDGSSPKSFDAIAAASTMDQSTEDKSDNLDNVKAIESSES